ncbi:hypothetical protein D9758_002035 [Tetrapyrgos nigripes]|uniref:Ribonuclease H1 N-terminal domain-containing protein n=1 Tax=Tetrapyrgos nigripes TaxID=182062 RepID=A0A8H5GTH4_9AGAR|nr:hypothetical protein D9758_002035 [Tetrapyrgos nigripes]
MPKKKFYAVIVGKDVGIYDTWLEASPLVNGVSGAQHASFCSLEEAQRVFEEAEALGRVRRVDSGLASSSSRQQAGNIPTNRRISSAQSTQTASSNYTMEMTSRYRDASASYRLSNRAASPTTPQPSTPGQPKKPTRIYPIHAEPSPPESYKTYGIESLEDSAPTMQSTDLIRRQQQSRSISTGSSRYQASRGSISHHSSSSRHSVAVGSRRSSVSSASIQQAVVGNLSDADSYPEDSDESSGPEDVTPRRDGLPGEVLLFTVTGAMTFEPPSSNSPKSCSPCKRTKKLGSVGVNGKVCARCGGGFRSAEASPEASSPRREDPFTFFSQPIHVSSFPYEAARDPRSPMQKGTKIPGLTSSPSFGRPMGRSMGEPRSLLF